MSDISKDESLDAILLLQRVLEPVNAGESSLFDALADSLPSLLGTLGCSDGRLLLLNEEGGVALFLTVIDGRVARQTPVTLSEILVPTIEAQVISQRKAVLVADTSTTTKWEAGPFASTDTEPWSVISVPLVTANSVTGAVSMFRSGRNRFSTADVPVLLILAEQIATAHTLAKYRARLAASEGRFQNLLQDRQDLAAILVHDLQGPAGNVVTSLEMIEESISSGSDFGLAALVDIAVRSSRHLQSLIESLLDISRLETGQMVQKRRPLNVSKLIEQVLDVAAPDFEERRVGQVVEIEPDLPNMLANEDMMRRVLYNLLDNALKQSKQNQTITIRAKNDPEHSAVVICVADQGPGIPEEFRTRIFEKFQRVERDTSSKGLGLGLAFCKLAVEAHGGRIWVENCEEGGACFCLAIPAADNTPSATSV